MIPMRLNGISRANLALTSQAAHVLYVITGKLGCFLGGDPVRQGNSISCVD
jgi:hypothetical protein